MCEPGANKKCRNVMQKKKNNRVYFCQAFYCVRNYVTASKNTSRNLQFVFFLLRTGKCRTSIHSR